MEDDFESYEEELRTAKSLAKNLALNRLNRRECSSQEVSNYLIRKKVSPEIASEVVQELVEKDWINDQRFARILIRHYLSQAKGGAYIRQKLREKGISMDLPQISEISNEFRQVTEEETVTEILKKKYPDAWTDPKEKGRAFQGLIRRGFSYSLVKSVLDKRSKI